MAPSASAAAWHTPGQSPAARTARNAYATVSRDSFAVSFAFSSD